MRPTLLLVSFFSLHALLRADVVPAPLFTDHAVLQRDKPIPVWGTAAPGENVTVTFAGQSATATADATGKWMVKLASLPANATPAALVIQGHNTITLADVVVGEVWLASGQSNMALTLDRTYDAALDIPATANFPLIRQLKIKPGVAATPAARATVADSTWQVVSPATASAFTAVGYFFARDLYEQLHVPVGIINCAWSGTRIEAWLSPAALSTNPAFASVTETWTKVIAEYPASEARYEADTAAWKARQTAARAARQLFSEHAPAEAWGPGRSATPSGASNGMIAPLAPYAVRGAIWYQGEANAKHASSYHALFSAMITDWRTLFAQGDFPFYWVQLPNYKDAAADLTDFAFLREAQTQTLALPATGQAVTIDLGDANVVHPRFKPAIGRRLARLALARTYGLKIADSGPLFAKATREGAGFRVSFTQIGTGISTPTNTLTGFELAGADRVFKPAYAYLEKDTILVTSAAVPNPVAVRYAWRNAPIASVFNKEGLPLAPFRTDNW